MEPKEAAVEGNSPDKSAPPAPAVKIRVTIENGLVVHAQVLPANPIDPQLIRDALKEHGVTFGLDDEAIKDLASFPPDKPMVVGRGKEPSRGADAQIEYFFVSQSELHPTEGEDGRVDFRNLQTLDSAYAGQVLAHKLPAMVGEPGISVRGEVLPGLVGKDATLAVGKNAQLSDDGLEVMATMAGRPQLQGSRVTVLPLMEVKDVDFSTGNISVEGSLLIRGSVMPGFRVDATEDIHVDGGVEGAFLKAGRNIVVRRSVRAKAEIHAGQDIMVHYVDSDSTLAAGNKITVETDALHSVIDAHHRVHIGRKLIGGRTEAGESVEAQTIGTMSETPTYVSAGWIPSDEIMEQLRLQIVEENRHEHDLAAQLGQAMSHPHSPEKIQLSRRLLQEKVHADRHLIELNHQLKEMEHPPLDPIVKATDRVFGKTTIVLAGCHHHVHEMLLGPSFRLNGREVKVILP